MRHQTLASAALGVLSLAVIGIVVRISGAEPAGALPTAAPTATETPTELPSPTDPPPSASPTPTEPPVPLLGEPWGEVVGMLQFRGNPQHTWYGLGPVPFEPTHTWRYPARAMCSTEVVGSRQVPVMDPATGQQQTDPETGAPVFREEPVIKEWCGTGWTGQPIVWERPDGITEVIFGAYDGGVHFLDAATGQRTRPTFFTGQMIKGTVTLDPDGFPLLYTGSRDNHFRVIALDRPEPTELWRMSPHPQGRWNNDWDGNASIVDGVLHVGGEDSWYRAVDLRRSYDESGMVVVDPVVLVEMPGFTDQLFRDVGDGNVSIENSVAVDVERDRLWFGNSAGRVVALDISRVRDGEVEVVLDIWLGDDIDGSIVVDHDGTVVIPIEYERKNARSREVGQLVKLDADRPDDPIVWSVHVPDDPRPGVAEDDGGIWATPALYAGHLYVTTHPGDLLVVDAATGEVTYTERIGYHEWASPVVVDDTLVVARCDPGALLAYGLDDPSRPVPMWAVDNPSGACIESTPTVWKGSIYVGSRDGFFHAWR